MIKSIKNLDCNVKYKSKLVDTIEFLIKNYKTLLASYLLFFLTW